MSDDRYLRDHIYYDELYDKFTIQECQYWGKCKEEYEQKIKTELDPKKKLKHHAGKLATELGLYVIKGERYANKSETIRKWMDRDKAKDEKLENAVEPRGIRCLQCSSPDMICPSRNFMNDPGGKEEVLFMFRCDKCDKRRAYWENGKEWEHKPSLCSKCNAEMQHSSSRKGEIITTVYSCSQCGNKEKDTFDLSVKEEPIDPNFEMNRKKYCLSNKEGSEYISQKEGMESMKHLVDGWEDKKKNKALYDAIAKIKKLTIFELQGLLNPILEKAGYVKLELEKPELQKDVVLGFSVQDSKSGRSEWDSVHELQKLFKKALEGTNWRLMSDGVRYRLGFLQGRLKGVEGEENLRRLIEKNVKAK
ncbi:MAG: hypothetical protein WC858_01770 [Parcubacteria group bacterium]|jgi:hypothetical protein